MVTEQEARDMWAAIQAFQQKDADAQKAVHENNIRTAQNWYNSHPEINHNPTTRAEALEVFNKIEQMLRTETDRYRLTVLINQKEFANEKFKEIKKNG